MKLNISKRWLATFAITSAVFSAGSAFAQPYINVTVGGAIAPGVYGQIAIGSNPPPPIINTQPVIVGAPVYGTQQPLYIHVPEEQRRDWGRYCASYRACGYPVYFVQMDSRNPWWTRHNEHLRGREAYRTEERYEDRRGDGRDGRHGGGRAEHR